MLKFLQPEATTYSEVAQCLDFKLKPLNIQIEEQEPFAVLIHNFFPTCGMLKFLQHDAAK
jgi:hypothetical protein